MSEAITIANIYKLFERTEAQFAEFQKEAERRNVEAERRSAEAEQRNAEADRRNAEAERRSAEADRTMEELKKLVRATTEAVNNLTTPLCLFTEEMLEPAVVQLFQERGIDVTQTMSRLKSKRPGAAMEIDILAVNGSELVAVECKSRLSKDDVDDFLDRLQRFKLAFPQFRDFQVYGAVAGIEIDQGIDIL
ncbi:DUF3782 domain-containing protein [Microcystis sp. Msp_OC_L_20101000_S702]|uniref:DUF3782 domain-containing protein n=1 Tax=Microcystis sp. Msp_OC_L_20101000_S702 TaxID=2486218 RepID=UPI00257A2AB1|nr:DUF3782 domain-containing protein [Microcystis sp. Msp_OC_L_20101000_S702]